MNLHKLPILFQEAIFALRALHNTPDELSIPAVLGAANLAVQGHYNVNSVVFGIRPISLFILGIVPTGGSKTTIFNEVTKGIEKFETFEKIRISNEDVRFAADNKVFQKEMEKWVKEQTKGPTPAILPTPSSGQMQVKLQTAIANLKGKPGTPLPPKKVSNNVIPTTPLPAKPKPRETATLRGSKGTLNGIIEILKSQSTFGLASSEAGEFFNSYSFQGGKDASRSIEIAAGLTSMWDGERIEKMTGMEQTTLYHRRVMMLFLLQEEVVRAFLSNSMFSSQGFIHRFLITQCGDYKKLDMDLSIENQRRTDTIRQQLDGFNDRVYDLISKSLNVNPTYHFELMPDTLELDKDARTLWQDFFNKHNNSLPTELKDYEGFGYRLAEHCLRIAATLAAFEKKYQIDAVSMEGAIELMGFFIKQRGNLNIEGSVKDAQKVTIANKLIDWIKDKKFDDSLRVLRQKAPFGYQKMDAIQREGLLAEMVSSGEVELYEVTAVNNKMVTKIRKVA